MTRSHFTSEQNMFALRQADPGTLVIEVCRKMGIVEQIFYDGQKVKLLTLVDDFTRESLAIEVAAAFAAQ